MLERKWLRLQYRLKCLIRERPRRVLFLHIPKCAGTTVHRHFKTNFGGGRSGKIAMLDSMTDHANGDAHLADARGAQYVSGHCGWSAVEAAGEGAFCFTIVREPFERLQSLYLFSRMRPSSSHRVFAKLFDAAKRLDFGSFCLSEDLELRALIDNAQTRTLARDYYPFRAQDGASLVRAATAHLSALDLVIDAAHLDHEFPDLAARTQTQLTRSPRRLNETPCPIRAGLTREEFVSDRRLYALVAQDLDLYEHALGLMGRRSKQSLAA